MDLRAKIPPVPLALIVGAAMWLAARATPDWRLAIPGARLIEVSFAGAGVLFAALGVIAFRRAQTTVDPLHPAKASTLVTTGVYRVTRNPMYVGLLLLLAGYAVYLANPVTLLGLAAFVAYLDRFQIAPEEEALTTAFGDEFTRYRQRVRRWL